MKNKPTIVLVLSMTALAGVLAGCSLLGSNASDPGKFEENLYQRTNVPVVLTHDVTNTITVQKVVEVPVTNVVTVIRTNEVGVLVPVYSTNVVEVTRTNTVQEARVAHAGDTVLVPQLAGPTATNSAIQSTASGIAGMFGYGGIAAALLSGLGNWWQRSRNAALMAKYTGVSEAHVVATQAAGALTQQVETLLEVLKGTPQGAALLPTIKNFLIEHQNTTGTLQYIAQLVNANVDNQEAREVAGDILKVVGLKTA